MLIVTGIAEVAESEIERVKVEAAKMAKASRAEEGCHAYAFFQDIENDNQFRIYEEWENPDALRAHFKTQHMALFNVFLKTVEGFSINISQFMRGEDIKVG